MNHERATLTILLGAIEDEERKIAGDFVNELQDHVVAIRRLVPKLNSLGYEVTFTDLDVSRRDYGVLTARTPLSFTLTYGAKS